MKIKYYCLSLKRYREKRFLKTKSQYFDKHNIPIVEFEGIDGTIINSSKNIAKTHNIILGKKIKKSSPVLVSIAQSHRNIWNEISKDTIHDYYIIFEDDIEIISNDFKKNINEIILDFDKLCNPKILLLGYLNVNPSVYGKLKSTNKFSGLQCYMIESKTAKYLFNNTKILEDQIDIMLSDYLLLYKYYNPIKLVKQKNIESIGHNQRNIFLESFGIKWLTHRIGVNFILDLRYITNNTYHINLTYNTIFNFFIATILKFDLMYIFGYFLFLLFEIFIYGGVIFMEYFKGFNRNSKYDDDEVINKFLDFIIFSLVLLLKI